MRVSRLIHLLVSVNSPGAKARNFTVNLNKILLEGCLQIQSSIQEWDWIPSQGTTPCPPPKYPRMIHEC